MTNAVMEFGDRSVWVDKFSYSAAWTGQISSGRIGPFGESLVGELLIFAFSFAFAKYAREAVDGSFRSHYITFALSAYPSKTSVIKII